MFIYVEYLVNLFIAQVKKVSSVFFLFLFEVINNLNELEDKVECWRLSLNRHTNFVSVFTIITIITIF